MSILQTVNLVKRFPGVVALKGVSFELAPGEIHALCGENGAGKSTLIKTLSGIHPYGSYEGQILMDGREMRLRGVADAESAGIGVIYQELALVGDMTVAENLFLGREPTRGGLIDWLAVYGQAKETIRRFGIDLDPAARVRDLGVGRQQLVEIVKALAKNTTVLILDEPTAALAEAEVAILLDILRDVRKRGITCVYISHKLDEVFAIADRITVLRDGESIVTLEAAKTTKREVIRHMVGREITDLFPRRASHPGKTLLSVQNLTVLDADDQQVLTDISFDVRAGEVLGIGGLMGSGRTELLMHIFGALGRRIGGEVLLADEPLESNTPDESIRRGLVLVSEDRKRYGLILSKSIGFNLSLSSLRAVSGGGGFVDANSEFSRNKQMFDSLRVKAATLEALVGKLSGGNQQKVVLGKALLTAPRVVFLDEPTRGIDVGAKLEVYELINRLTEQGQAVVLVSSELPELMGMSDRILMLHEGAVGGRFDDRATTTQEGLLAAAMGHLPTATAAAV
jgi:D-xylose transport system ATP-binding protein